eukprot:CAMPEP_0173115986 /NCGR_PEP_ID=MMETSP1102-20130122/48946_1 /TAXON_ID=49646 /ORGANISM="Geminigera sp., Strain Caron Lab Isolate" /LENGTH=82 /DNA_ID=CAMNT_0014019365 /DNA_START=92 /DNA_END=340 /DNA_ORIENTATION=-
MTSCCAANGECTMSSIDDPESAEPGIASMSSRVNSPPSPCPSLRLELLSPLWSLLDEKISSFESSLLLLFVGGLAAFWSSSL